MSHRNQPFARTARSTAFLSCAFVLLLCSACGGGGDSSALPAPPTGIGAAGGTISDASGAMVVVPAGALTANTAIAVTQLAAGAPALPAGVLAKGQIFAFTPHGTTFATPVTITVPFDSTSVPAGTTLALYKTNATQSAWEMVAGATLNGGVMSGQVTGFSFAVVALPPATDETLLTEKTWNLKTYSRTGTKTLTRNDLTGDPPQLGGKVEQYFFESQIGLPLPVIPADLPPDSPVVGAYSNDSGRTFWTLAIAPHGSPTNPQNPTGDDSKLSQIFTFEASEDHPSLHFLITASTVEVIDYGGAAAGQVACPWLSAHPSTEQLESCAAGLTDASASIHFSADSFADGGTFFDAGALIDLGGIHGEWNHFIQSTAEHALWTGNDFTVNEDVDADGARRHARISLKAPVRVDVPVEHLHKGDVFVVFIDSESYSSNYLQGESYVGAYFRDPLSSSGIGAEFTGLKLIPPRHDVPTGFPAIGCAGGPDPTAGTLQLRAAAFSAPEAAGRASLVIERVGGTNGLVSVRLATSAGTAASGSDYESLSTEVRFADGEDGERVVFLPLLNDDIAEEDETVGIALSNVGGCATLGAQQTATLTILDDDRPIAPPPAYTIGGTVSGLAGTGLVLREELSGSELAATANGSFTLPGSLLDGASYSVVVKTLPANPLQNCTITNGVGTVASGNVTSIAVICTTPAASGSLDTSFGDQGRTVTAIGYFPQLLNSRIGMALQADGKILLVGGLKLLRFNVDGTLDTGFGAGGVVDVVFNGGSLDTAVDVAVQSDGRIVVAGTTASSLPGADPDDFALTRFNADGSLDGSFGTAGHTRTDFFGSTDQIRRMKLQPDDKIVVTGYATQVVSSSPLVASVLFATARYSADGVLDSSFGYGASATGKVVDSPFASYSIANSLVIQSDGKILVAGKTANDGVSNPDIGLVRYIGSPGGVQTVGDRDETFGPLPFPYYGVYHAGLAPYDAAVDVAVKTNGGLIVAVDLSITGHGFGFSNLDANASSLNPHVAPFVSLTPDQDVPRAMLVQSDGKIVTVGQASWLGANPDMALVRLNADGLSLDTTFGTDGKLILDTLGTRESAEAVVQQADGKLVVGGYVRGTSGNVFTVVRISP